MRIGQQDWLVRSLGYVATFSSMAACAKYETEKVLKQPVQWREIRFVMPGILMAGGMFSAADLAMDISKQRENARRRQEWDNQKKNK